MVLHRSALREMGYASAPPAVSEHGPGCCRPREALPEDAGWYARNEELVWSLAAGFLLGIAWTGERWMGLPHGAAITLYVVSYGFGGFDVVRHWVGSLRRGRLTYDIDLLMLLAALGAALEVYTFDRTGPKEVYAIRYGGRGAGMPDQRLVRVALFALIPVTTMVVGSTIAAVRPPGARVRSGIQHFAAGVVFAVVAVELLPDLRATHDPWEIALGFALGVAFMLLLERFTGAHGEGGEGEADSGAVGRALVTLVGGAALGDTLPASASEEIMATVLAVGSAALLFLVTEELLVEAREVKETTWATSMFFLGFLGLFLLGTV